jgi:hypothetical protein
MKRPPKSALPAPPDTCERCGAVDPCDANVVWCKNVGWVDEYTRTKYLTDNGYESVAAWALDSDYAKDDNGDWFQIDNPDHPVNIVHCLYDAIEAANEQ